MNGHDAHNLSRKRHIFIDMIIMAIIYVVRCAENYGQWHSLWPLTPLHLLIIVVFLGAFVDFTRWMLLT